MATTSSRLGVWRDPGAPGLGNAADWMQLAALMLAGLVLAECVRDGGFWTSDALVVTILGAMVLVLRRWAAPRDRTRWTVAASVLALALWWLIRAGTAEGISRFLPLGASLIGFAAAFMVIGSLDASDRELAASFVGLVGALVAAAGFVGLVLRWTPLAIPAQHLWRLSSTITYADAAGLLLAVALLMTLSVETRPWVTRACVCLCAGGLLATQSRGAMVAFACAAAVVPWRRYLVHLVPLVVGILVGALAIATSPWHHRVPVLGVACLVAVGLSVAWPARLNPSRLSGRAITIAAVAVVVVAAGVIVTLHHEIGLRAFSPSDRDRAVEWSAAWHQFVSAVVVGVGPDRVLHFHAVDGTYAHFAHNEYLQIAADAGLIGLGLLAVAVVNLVRVTRRDSLMASCAVAGLFCLAVGGAFDFDWHLPVIGLLGGWVAGLGSPLPMRSAASRSSPRSGSG